MNINEKELIKQIRSAKHQLIWSVQDDIHYITNRHWAVRFEQLPKTILTALFSIFAAIPNNNSSFREMRGEPHPIVDIAKVMTISESAKSGKITDIIQQSGDILMRVITCKDDLYFINNEYMKILGGFEESPLCTTIHGPIAFCDGNVFIIPFHMVKVTNKKVIQDLIAL